MDLKRILGVAGSGVALSGLLFMGFSANKKSEREIIRVVSSITPTTLIHDTIDISVTKEGYVIADDGEYDTFQDVATTHFFRDVSGTEIGQYAANMINEDVQFNDYHEVRHAWNSRLIMHYNKDVTSDILAVDEVSARVAACIAAFGQMPASMKSGDVWPNVSYTLSESYDFQKIVDASFVYVLAKLRANNTKYAGSYRKNAYLISKRLLRSNPYFDKKSLIDEMMTFEVNGKSHNLLKVASKDVREKVLKYINEYKQK